VAAEAVHVAKLFGIPRLAHEIVTWCRASGSSVQKSQLLSALRMPVRGSRLMAWLRSGEPQRVAEEEQPVYCCQTTSQFALFRIEF